MIKRYPKGREKRKLRIKRILGKGKIRNRLSVFRSNRYFYAQIIDMDKNHTLASVSEKELTIDGSKKITKSERAGLLGTLIGQKARKAKINKIVFDRNGFKYHGRIKTFAQKAKEEELIF